MKITVENNQDIVNDATLTESVSDGLKTISVVDIDCKIKYPVYLSSTVRDNKPAIYIDAPREKELSLVILEEFEGYEELLVSTYGKYGIRAVLKKDNI